MTLNQYDDNEFLYAASVNALVNAANSEGVISGVTPSKGTGDFDVDTTSGTTAHGDFGTEASPSSATTTLSSADSSNDRVDLITVNSSGTVSATEGTAASNPVSPDIPSDEVLIAVVVVPAGASSLSASDINDRRVILDRNSPTLLTQQTASADSEITFTDNLTSTFTRYEIEVTDVVMASDTENLLLQVSNDGGSTWQSDAADYTVSSEVLNEGSNVTTGGDATEVELNQQGSAGDSSNGMGNAGGETAEFTVVLSEPSNGSRDQTIRFEGTLTRANGTRLHLNGSAFYNTAEAIDGIRFFGSNTTNISSGTFSLYGKE